MKKLIQFYLTSVLIACDDPAMTASVSDDMGEIADEDVADILESAVDTEESRDTQDGKSPSKLVDFSQPGPYRTAQESRSAAVTNCDSMDYIVHSPVGIDDPPVVVLGHGFARGPDVMSGWADHLSSWGVEVLLPTLCHYNVWLGVDHEMNGQNMRELAAQHGATAAVYAGHSAGGLAAIIAASQDSSPIGVLGLDTTDTQDIPGVRDFIGREYAGDVTAPAFSLRGEASTCNANNNGIDLFRMMPDYRAVKIASADHCDFENPTDIICEAGCENTAALFGDEDIRSAIISLGTAGILSLTSLSEDGTYAWSDAGIQTWVESGLVQEVE